MKGLQRNALGEMPSEKPPPSRKHDRVGRPERPERRRRDRPVGMRVHVESRIKLDNLESNLSTYLL